MTLHAVLGDDGGVLEDADDARKCLRGYWSKILRAREDSVQDVNPEDVMLHVAKAPKVIAGTMSKKVLCIVLAHTRHRHRVQLASHTTNTDARVASSCLKRTKPLLPKDACLTALHQVALSSSTNPARLMCSLCATPMALHPLHIRLQQSWQTPCISTSSSSPAPLPLEIRHDLSRLCPGTPPFLSRFHLHGFLEFRLSSLLHSACASCGALLIITPCSKSSQATFFGTAKRSFSTLSL